MSERWNAKRCIYILVEVLDDTLEEIVACGGQAVNDAADTGDFGIKIRSVKGYVNCAQH